MTLKLNSKYLESFVNSDELAGIKPQVETAVDLLHNKKGLGNDFLGCSIFLKTMIKTSLHV